MLEGDQIYNGADDNASGVQAVLQVARAFLATGEQPERTVIFAFWDGEQIVNFFVIVCCRGCIWRFNSAVSIEIW